MKTTAARQRMKSFLVFAVAAFGSLSFGQDWTQFDPGVVDAFLHLVDNGSIASSAAGTPHGIAAR